MPVLLVGLLSFTVHYLLLLGAAGLYRVQPSLPRNLLAAALGAVYVALCMLPGAGFLGHILCRLGSLVLIGLVAFGWQAGLLGTLLLLCLGIDAAVTGVRSALIGIGIIGLLWLLGKGRRTIPIRLRYDGKELALTALQDTGNLLRDPITGIPVLVIGPEAARQLTGLTVQQLRAPLETIQSVPGLRLIPYKTIGGSGFLLALKVDNVKIGHWRGSRMVAFAPEGLGGNQRYEALTGGIV